MQSAFAVGYGLAALVAFVVLQFASWRIVFFVGLALLLLLSFWMARHVPESEAWKTHSAQPQTARASFIDLFRPPPLGRTTGPHAHERLLHVRLVGFSNT